MRSVTQAAALAGAGLLLAACSQLAPEAKPQVKPTALEADRPLPPVVGGVPLLELAKRALGAAEAYSVSRPAGVRAVVTTQAALYAQVATSGGAAEPEYVVVLEGRFTCGSCGSATAPSTITTDPSSVHVSPMVLQLPLLSPDRATVGVAVRVGRPDLAVLGHVYDLDPYVRSLTGVDVPIGPLPG